MYRNFVRVPGWKCVNCRRNDMLELVVNENGTASIYCRRCKYYTQLINRCGLVRKDAVDVIMDYLSGNDRKQIRNTKKCD